MTTTHGPKSFPDGMRYKGKRQLRNFLLDRLQLRYAALIVFISALLTAGLGLLVYRYARDATETVKVTVLGVVEDPQAQAQVLSSFAEGDRRLLFTLIGFGVLLCGVLTIYGIVVTHKVAGPLYKLSTYFTQMKEGRLPRVDALRRGDLLQDFYESFCAMHEAMRKRTHEEIAELGQVIEALEAGPPGPSSPSVEALRSLKRAKEQSLT